VLAPKGYAPYRAFLRRTPPPHRPAARCVRRAALLAGSAVYVCASEELAGAGSRLAMVRRGGIVLGADLERTRSCGLLAPGNVMLFGLARRVMSLGLLGFTPGAYPPTPWAKTRLPDRRMATTAPDVCEYAIFIVIPSELDRLMGFPSGNTHGVRSRKLVSPHGPSFALRPHGH